VPFEETRKVTLILPIALVRQLDHFCVDTGLTRSEVVTRLLRDGMDRMHAEAMK